MRPSIIGSSYREPSPGWIDSIAAAGAIYLTAALGVVDALPGDLALLGDQIPCDYVSNCIIASTAYYANRNNLGIVHSTSTDMKPLNWMMVKKYFMEFANKIKVPNSFGPPKMDIYRNPIQYKTMVFMKQTLPFRAYALAARVIGNPEMLKNAKTMTWAEGKMEKLRESFEFFTSNEWVYDCYMS